MMLRIGMVGTFDVKGFGDLLFPLVARHELSRRLGPVEICPFSYNARSAPSWPFDVSPIERLATELPTLDLLLVGGGDIIRFDARVAPGYYPNSPRIHHPTGFWLSPIFMAHVASVPVVWNAPGLPGSIPRWAWPLVRASVAVSAYVSVRDEASRDILAPLASGSVVEVVPDTGFGAAALLASETATPQHSSEALDPAQPDDGYFVVQSRPEWRDWLPRGSHAGPGQANVRAGQPRFVLTPVAPALGDLVRSPGELPSHISFRTPLDPYQLLTLVDRSRGVVGTSLHLTLAALSLGRPALRPGSAALRKYRMLDGLAGVHSLDPGVWAGRDGEAGSWPTAPDPAQLSEIHGRLARHWDAVASIARANSVVPRSTRSWTPALVDFWEQLPGALERRSIRGKLRDALRVARERVGHR